VGLVAINDSFLIQAAVFKLLKRHFRAKPYYVELLELMNEVRQIAAGMGVAGGGWLEASFSHRRLPTFPNRPFSQTTYQTELGQLLDLITAPEDRVDLSRFSIEK
jgi:farnesyl diphosphate synthase